MTGLKKSLKVQTDGNARLCGMLGLAMRAGKVIVGTESVCTALAKRGKLRLVVYAFDASAATKKKITTKCDFYGVPAVEIYLDTGTLGKILGKTYGPACAALTCDSFANEIVKCVAP